jgi:hypothetical protein
MSTEETNTGLKDSTNRCIRPVKFQENLKENMESTLLTEENNEMPELARVLYSQFWPESIDKILTFGGTRIQTSCQCNEYSATMYANGKFLNLRCL